MSPDDLGLVLFTVGVALCATAAIFVPGVAFAFGLARWRWRGKALIETVLSLPLVLPPTAVGLLLLELLARDSAVGSFLDRIGLEVVFTWKAVVLATAVMAFPLLVRSARTAFEEVDPRLEQMARTLGCSRGQAFLRVSLPLAFRGIAAGSVLAFSRALGEFGATILVAGNIPGRTQTLSLAIFHRIQLGDDAGAMRLVAVTVVLAFAAVFTAELLLRRRQTRQAP